MNGKIESLEEYFYDNFNDAKNVWNQKSNTYKVGDIVFTNNGYYDLESKGLNGFGIWIGYVHSKSGAPLKRCENDLRSFVYNDALPVFEDYINSIGGDVDNIVIEDKIRNYDLFRIYYITSDDE